jgi:ABC-2 type transport system ATP-binding protein
MNKAIEIKQLDFSYGKKHVLKNLSIDIHENQIIGLIGRNGSGKTTIMKLCAGLLSPESGEIKISGLNPVNNLSALREIIYSYTKVPHKPSLTLESIIESFAEFYEHFDKVFAYKLLDFFALNRRLKYSSLSQGMASVISFICAISTRAKLTLLDEPVVGMDISVRRKVYEVLLRDYIENPRTIIISSHILSELSDLLSEMIILDNGEILLYRPMEELQTMAYRVEGSKEAVNSFIIDRPVLYKEHKITGSSAIIEETLDTTIERDCKQLNLVLSKVDPEELYICKTNRGKEMDFDCLWENQN